MKMNNAELWQQFKLSQSPILKKQIILNYVNLVHYVIHHSKFAINSILDERDYFQYGIEAVSYTHLRAHETVLDIVCRLLLEKKRNEAHARTRGQETG